MSETGNVDQRGTATPTDPQDTAGAEPRKALEDIVVVAMGGNSLIDPNQPPTVENQFRVTADAVVPIADLIALGVPLVLTHGNGPQVGFMQLRSELSRNYIHEVPLDSLVADSQGGIGYMIQRVLREELLLREISAEVVTLVTEVEVDPRDPAFSNPTKPVGRFYDRKEAERLRQARHWQMVEDADRGYRRVVPSPRPLSVVQLPTVERLVRTGTVVITCGGGGIPVTLTEDGGIRGVEAVIDKDLATALLAARLGARRLFITTGVDAVYRDYLTEMRVALHELTITELQVMLHAGQFPPGSMGPKVRAAIQFLREGGQEVVICRPEALLAAFQGQAGTRIIEG